MAEMQLKNLRTDEPIVLDNTTCVYCGTALHAEIDTEEHVIGRKFVPKGKLDCQWNLIVRACKACNANKADLEDDISAITMQPDTRGRYVVEDELLMREASRKGRGSNSRWTHRRVKDSYEELKIEAPIGPGAKFTFNLTGLPTIEHERIFELALLQVRAFFYLITYEKASRQGHFWPGGFYTVMHSPRSDWGNAAQKAFMAAIHDWEPRFHGIGADEFFKVVIRRHPMAVCWSWAVEWNHNLRAIGFLGELDPAKQIVATFPPLDWKPLPDGSKGVFRTERKLDAEHDSMFDVSRWVSGDSPGRWNAR